MLHVPPTDRQPESSAPDPAPTAPREPAVIRALRERGFRVLFVADALVLYASMVVINLARFGFQWPTYPLSHYIAGFAIATAIHLLVGYFGGLYEHEPRLAQRVWLPRIVWLTSIAVLIDAGVALVTGRYLMPRGNLVALWIVASLGLAGTRALSRSLVRRRGGPARVLLVGEDQQITLAGRHLARSRHATVVGGVHRDAALMDEVDRLSPTDVLLLEDRAVELIYPEPLATLEQRNIGVLQRVSASDTVLGLSEVREVAGMPVTPLRSHTLPRSAVHFKRLWDLALLLTLAPIILPLTLLTALYVRIVAGPGVLYRQERVGKGGSTFRMVKFRTMVRDAEAASGAVLSERNDPRVVPACRWLRSTRLDELPQGWNVLLGQMSIVGPRPERPEMTAGFEAQIPGYGRRHEVPPGMTGLAQVQGRYDTDPEFKLGHDLQYLVNWTVVLDVQILLRTIWVVLRRQV